MKLHIGQSNLVSLQRADRQRVLADMRAFGFTGVRFEVPFHAWSFPWQAYNWQPVIDTMRDVESADIEGLPVLGAHMPFFWKPSAAQYGGWVSKAMTTLQAVQLVRQVEVWNEPNLISFWSKADPKTFYPYAQAAYDSIKAAYPSVEVVLAGMAAYDTAIQWPFVGGAKAPDSFINTMTTLAKGKKFYDRLGYHAYNLTEGDRVAEPTATLFGIKMLNTLRQIHPDVLVTEFGFAGPGDAQAVDWLTKELALLNADEAYLYCWRNSDGEKFGLVDENNRPKQPYYDAVKALLWG